MVSSSSIGIRNVIRYHEIITSEATLNTNMVEPASLVYWERLCDRHDRKYDTGIEGSIIVHGQLLQCEIMMGDFALTCIPLDMQV